jgi:hypothetical protein
MLDAQAAKKSLMHKLQSAHTTGGRWIVESVRSAISLDGIKASEQMVAVKMCISWSSSRKRKLQQLLSELQQLLISGSSSRDLDPRIQQLKRKCEVVGKEGSTEFQEDYLRLSSVMQSSEITLRRAGREAGGAGAGSSSFFLRAGEDFEVVVSIKDHFGPVTGAHVLPIFQAIGLFTLPGGLVKRTGEPRLCTETGTACFPVRIERSGDLELSAAVEFNEELKTIGQKTRVRVAPGAMLFASLNVKASAEVGEQVQLVLQGSDKDVFGNHIGVPLSASAKADLLAIMFEGMWSHEGKESPLNLSQPFVTEGDLVVAELRLMLAGRHIFRIKSAGQELTASIEITPESSSARARGEERGRERERR